MTNRPPSDGSPSVAVAGATTASAGSAAPAADPAAAPAADPAAAPAADPAAEPNGVVRVVSLEAGRCRDLEGDQALAELRRALASRQATVWVDLCGMSPSLLAEVSKILDLHPLLVEDLGERDQRAKLEQVGDLIHLVVFSIGFDDGRVYDRELDFVLGKRFLLSSHSRWWDPRSTRHLKGGMAEALRRGLAHLLWALCDDTIDAYFPMLDRLGDEIDELEDEVVARADRALLERLFELKRELIQIRRITAPEREMFNVLSSREETVIPADERLYFRDAYDHLIRLTDELDTYRELASATLETYLSTVNNNLSLIMKRLTGVTVVVAGIGAVGGIFGMSEAQAAFRLDEGPGFWIVTAGCVFLAGIVAGILHKIDWI